MRDVLRLIVLIEASAAFWFVAIVLLRYRRRFLQAQQSGTAGRRKRNGGDMDWIGLLPLHVWLVSAATLFFMVQSVAITMSNLGHALIWYGTPLSAIAFPLLVGALFTIASYENRVSGRS